MKYRTRGLNFFGFNADGEHNVWWYHIDRTDQYKRPAGSLRFHIPSNTVSVEWSLRGRSCRLSLSLQDMAVGDEQISLGIALPFIGSFWFSLDRARWVERLPGVDWNNKDYESGHREISLRFFENAFWWCLWRNPDSWSRGDQRQGAFHFDNFFLGRAKRSETPRKIFPVDLVMPEGVYPVTVELYQATWKRPRWPWPIVSNRATVKIEGGLPIPGDGEEAWSMEDDATYESTFPCATVEEALIKVRESTIKERIKYGGEDWVPNAGWPDHCRQVSQ